MTGTATTWAGSISATGCLHARHLRWESTDYFDRVRLGHNDDEHVEITEAEAQQFVERLTAKLG